MTGSKPNMPKPTSCPTRSTRVSARSNRRSTPSSSARAIYDPADIAIAGVFVSLDADGSLSVDRGYVRPEDEASGRDRRQRCGDGG
jgi:hypothetical protein